MSDTRTISVQDEYRYFIACPAQAVRVRMLWAALDQQAERVKAFLAEIGAGDQYIGAEDHIRSVSFKAGTTDPAWREDRVWRGYWTPNKRHARGRELAKRIDGLFTVDRRRRTGEIFGVNSDFGKAANGKRYLFHAHAQPIGDAVIVMLHSSMRSRPQGCTEIPRSRYYAMVEAEEAKRAAPGPAKRRRCPANSSRRSGPSDAASRAPA